MNDFRTFPLVQLRHVSAIPIVNGLGEAGDPENDTEWPRYIRTTDIATVRTLDSTKRVTLPPEAAQRATVRRGDILMTSAGSVGKSYLHSSDEIACFAGYLSRLRVRLDRALPEYVAYWTESTHYLDQVQSGAVKSTIENFSAAKYRAMRLPLPTLDVQRAIVDYLDRETAQIDAFIAKNEELITLLTERRDSTWDALYSEATTAGPSVPLRRVVSSIADGPFGSSLTSAHYSDAGTRVIRLGNVGINEFKNADEAFIPVDYAAQLSAHDAVAGDVIVAGLGDDRMPLGRACVLPDIGPAIVKADCYRVRPTPAVMPEYLAWVLSAPQTRGQMKLAARGSTRERLNTSVVLDVTIPVPAASEQASAVERFAKSALRIDSAIETARRGVELARERRAALISAAVTGKIDMGVAV